EIAEQTQQGLECVDVWSCARQPTWIACFVAASPTLIGADQQPQRYAETVNVASVLIDVRVLDAPAGPSMR
ncbi:MAG: hypothetical protein DMF96_25085, partial [Acidobacteria bacterium]